MKQFYTKINEFKQYLNENKDKLSLLSVKDILLNLQNKWGDDVFTFAYLDDTLKIDYTYDFTNVDYNEGNTTYEMRGHLQISTMFKIINDAIHITKQEVEYKWEKLEWYEYARRTYLQPAEYDFRLIGEDEGFIRDTESFDIAYTNDEFIEYFKNFPKSELEFILNMDNFPKELQNI